MDEKKTLLRLSRHLELIDKLEGLPLTDNVKLSELAKDKGQQVALYKDKKSDKFKGTPVDYLCWIGVCHNRYTNKISSGGGCRPDLDDIEQYFSLNQYPNCEVRLYFRNPDLFIKKDSGVSEIYRRMTMMSLVFANQYISQRLTSEKIKGKQFSVDELRQFHQNIGVILDEATTSQIYPTKPIHILQS
jgi:hypothetical protein